MAFSPSNLLSGGNPQPHEPAPKRQKMSSVTSESTLAGETPNVTTGGQVPCSVASEDLSSMMFHVADLQRVTNSWALHHPLTGAEAEMKASFKACEDTANSLRDTLESLEVNAASLAPAHDFGAAIRDSHESAKENDTDDGKQASVNEAKAADTLKFLIKTSIGKLVSDEFASLAKFEGTFKDLTYDRWYQHRVQCRDDIMKAMDQDPEPLVDFKDKVKRHFQRDLMDRVIGDFKRGLEGQWKKHGEFVADS